MNALEIDCKTCHSLGFWQPHRSSYCYNLFSPRSHQTHIKINVIQRHEEPKKWKTLSSKWKNKRKQWPTFPGVHHIKFFQAHHLRSPSWSPSVAQQNYLKNSAKMASVGELQGTNRNKDSWLTFARHDVWITVVWNGSNINCASGERGTLQSQSRSVLSVHTVWETGSKIIQIPTVETHSMHIF